MKSYQKACHRIIRKAENEILNVSINNSSTSEECNKNKENNTHSHANKC